MPPDPTVAALLRPDGSVVVPPQLAAEVLRTLVVGAATRARADGGVIGPGARSLLHALYEAAHHTPHGSAPGTPEPAPATVEITAQQAAQVMGCSAEYVRRLARTGQVRARRAGPAWLIDLASLDAYRTGGAACTPSTSPPSSAAPSSTPRTPTTTCSRPPATCAEPNGA